MKFLTLVRRWADVKQTDKELSDTIEMTEKHYHDDDVKMYFGKDNEEAVEHKESNFHMNEKKRKLQEHFAKQD